MKDHQTDLSGTDDPLVAYRRAQHAFTLNPSTSALVIVDLQYGSAHPDYGYGKLYRAIGRGEMVAAKAIRMREVVIPSVQRLQKAFRAVGAPVIFLTIGTIVGDLSDLPPRFRRAADHWRSLGLQPPYAKLGSREMDVLDEIKPLPGEAWIVKTGASGFTASPLERILWNKNIREIAFCGVATSGCVESTLRDASDRGFDVVLVEDACADAWPGAHDRGIKNCEGYGRVASADDLVAEIGAPIAAMAMAGSA